MQAKEELSTADILMRLEEHNEQGNTLLHAAAYTPAVLKEITDSYGVTEEQVPEDKKTAADLEEERICNIIAENARRAAVQSIYDVKIKALEAVRKDNYTVDSYIRNIASDERFIKRHPNDPNTYNCKGNNLVELAEELHDQFFYECAILAFTQAIELSLADKDRVPALCDRAQAYIKIGNYELAKADVSQLQSLLPHKDVRLNAHIIYTIEKIEKNPSYKNLLQQKASAKTKIENPSTRSPSPSDFFQSQKSSSREVEEITKDQTLQP